MIALLVSAQRDLLRGDALDRAAEGRNEITVVLVVAGVVSLADRAGTEEQDWAELRAQGEVHSDLHSDLHSYLPQSEALFAQLDADGDGALARAARGVAGAAQGGVRGSEAPALRGRQGRQRERGANRTARSPRC